MITAFLLLCLTGAKAQYNWITLPQCPNILVLVDSNVNTTPTHQIGRILILVYPQSDFTDSCLCEIPNSFYPGWEFTQGNYGGSTNTQGQFTPGTFGKWHAGNLTYNTPPPTEIYFDSAQSRFEIGRLQTNPTFASVYMQKAIPGPARISKPNPRGGKAFIQDMNGKRIGEYSPENFKRLPSGMYIIIDADGNFRVKEIRF